MFIVSLFIYLVSSSQKPTKAAKDTLILKSHQLSTFDELVGLINHCTFVSVSSYEESACEITHKESFCNEFITTVETKYRSPLVFFAANSTFSLINVRVSPIPVSKAWHSRCTVWIQYNIIVIPKVLASFEPDVFILYSNLDNLTYHFREWEGLNKASWLRALEPYFNKPMVIIHANPISNGISILCMHCSELETIARPVIAYSITDPFIPLATSFNHEISSRNLHKNTITYWNADHFHSQIKKYLKTVATSIQTCFLSKTQYVLCFCYRRISTSQYQSLKHFTTLLCVVLE